MNDTIRDDNGNQQSQNDGKRKPRRRPRLRLVNRTSWTAAELLAAEFPEPRHAVPGIIPEGLSLLAGRPKIGKSWLALGVAVSVASGTPALGKIEVESGPVLYLALEDTPRRLRGRLSVLLEDRKPPATLTLRTDCPKLDEGGDELIDNWLEQNPDARLVVVDVLKRVRGAPPQGMRPMTLTTRRSRPSRPSQTGTAWQVWSSTTFARPTLMTSWTRSPAPTG